MDEALGICLTLIAGLPSAKFIRDPYSMLLSQDQPLFCDHSSHVTTARLHSTLLLDAKETASRSTLCSACWVVTLFKPCSTSGRQPLTQGLALPGHCTSIRSRVS
eukprot:6463976-Amphidinium_carterae.1